MSRSLPRSSRRGGSARSAGAARGRASWPAYPVNEERATYPGPYLARTGQDARAAAVLRLVVPADRDTVETSSTSRFSDEYLLFVNGRPVAGGEAAYRLTNREVTG